MALTTSAIKAMAKEADKRVGKDFLEAWDRLMVERLKEALAVDNGKKTLDASVAEQVLGKK